MNQKVVVVTGCTEGGIGYHLAKEFAQNNCRVFATARRVEAIGDVEALGMEKVHLDVANKESIQTAIEQIVEKAGRIDILVNNAAIHSVGAIADVDLGQVRRAIETNVIGVLAMSQAVIPLMAAQGGGKIVNIGSIVGYLPLPWAGIYSMTKAALSSFSDTMRIEVKPFNIDVIVVTPDVIPSHPRPLLSSISQEQSNPTSTSPARRRRPSH
ncbi:hypothetical protein BC936DRAFT_140698 [Jimgerdemannia flammicorona]|uniref:Oxidoreductase n=1 Tax=Jimgerdemannia flammicorona TaxID=994334 RepID=A0A433ADR6_9FUNG|nr:hypothetical protein BC936DRAFT_140698 [Jimgerdemannia flammicorona]